MNHPPQITRLLHNAILLKRIATQSQTVKTRMDSFEVESEATESGLLLSKPKVKSSRCEVVAVGPKCRFRPGQTVVLAPKPFIQHEWKDESGEYLLMREGDSILFAFQVCPA